MENNEIRPGDLVYLKSDGKTVFTVGKITDEYSILSAKIFWFDHNTKEMKEKIVPVQILAKVGGH